NSFMRAAWKQPEANRDSMRNRMANLSTWFPPQGTVEGRFGNMKIGSIAMLLSHRRPQKPTRSRDCTTLPYPILDSGCDVEGQCWQPCLQLLSAYSRFR